MTSFQCPHCGSDVIRGDVEVSYTKVPIEPRGYAAQDGRIEETELGAVYCGECGTRLEVISWEPAELAVFERRPPEPNWRQAVKGGCPHCGAGRDGAEYGIGLQPSQTGAWQTWMPFFWQQGGEIVDDSGNFTLGSEACVEALTYYDSF
ncbi:MAG TPA: hypothetical protein ENO24_03175, partial [Chloroflexi bacterium]|nr:hypothetical protein [Chloroflexota bacterium]